MRIAKRLMTGIALPLLAWGIAPSSLSAADVLQCVPYARALSGIRIHGDAWTWWDQAKGHYRRGSSPRPGAVLSLANTDAMPLGHVAVVSQIVDDRRILLSHANWSAPGMIEKDVLAVDASPQNDWSEVRIWWGQSQQMGARINPANGFIYPGQVNERILLDKDTPSPFAAKDGEALRPGVSRSQQGGSAPPRFAQSEDRSGRQQLFLDLSVLRGGRELAGGHRNGARTLAMILGDVRREARLR